MELWIKIMYNIRERQETYLDYDNKLRRKNNGCSEGIASFRK